MSWLARSLANSLAPDHGAGEDESKEAAAAAAEAETAERSQRDGEDDDSVEPGSPGRGVKEDLSELTKTLTRQFWGVASFLAPPPTSQTSAHPQISSSADSLPSDPAVAGSSEEAEVPESQAIAGIRGDLAEIGGRFRTGISRLSNNAAVSELSKIASTFLPFGSEEEEAEEEGSEGGGAIGVTDEVLAFARNIAMHPETWLDFPLFHEEEDSDDFQMSNAQLEHAFAVESHEPRLAALRIELCPSHMSEAFFWKIYFVLLHSRLNKHDAELLSTPQIVEARARLLQRLQNQTKPEPEISKRSITDKDADDSVLSSQEQVTTSPPMPYGADPTKAHLPEEATTSVPITDVETQKQAVSTTEVPIIDKSVVKEEPLVQPKSKDLLTDSEISIPKEDDDVDDWLEEAEAENIGGGSASTSIPIGNDEDVSFSDLEEE